MNARSIKTSVAAAAAVLLTAGAVASWWQVERQQATVRRLSPAVAPFDPAWVRHLKAPPGFEVSLFASGLGQPRMMDVGSDGTVYVTRPSEGDVVALRDSDGDGIAERGEVFVAGLAGVHGVQVTRDRLYLASATTVWQVPLANAAAETLVTGLPDGGQHANRMVRLGPDGVLHVSVGSSCNDCAEDNLLERATIIRYGTDGTRLDVMANGLRNTIGYDWHPASGGLWGMDHGSDFRGDALPPEELNRILPGRNYGWPVCYGERVVDGMTNARPEDLALRPGQARPSGQPSSRQAWCERTEPSVLTLPAHSAPMALRFYRGTAFPPAFQGDAFVALHGSWNRGDPVGYKVVRLRFSPGGQVQGVEDFLTGFLGPTGRVVTGRPVGIALAADGALLVSDDANGAIYRVAAARPR